MKKEERIKKLEEEIEYEQMQYDNACEYPTETSQFYAANERCRVRIEKMKEDLHNLKNN